jgi:peptidoglycan hydrolase CwlO-like protein
MSSIVSSSSPLAARFDALQEEFAKLQEEVANLRSIVTPVKSVVAVAAKTVKEPKAPKKVAAPPPASSSGAPDASTYRLLPSEIDESTCIGRDLKGGEDKRWKPIIHRESQCGGKLAEGSDLCSKCAGREQKAAADPDKAIKFGWNGRVTEEPHDDVHMLGTAWAEKKKPVFTSTDSTDSDTESVAKSLTFESPAPAADTSAAPIVSSEEMSAPAKKSAAAAKAAKDAEKAAAKAAKEAEKADAKAAKEAEKAAAKAAKEAEKAAAKAAAPKKTTAKKSAAAAPAPDAKVSTAAEPLVAKGKILCIDGTMYMVKNANVYDYNEITDVVGDFVGRLNPDKTIDTDGDEVESEGSESDASASE